MSNSLYNVGDKVYIRCYDGLIRASVITQIKTRKVHAGQNKDDIIYLYDVDHIPNDFHKDLRTYIEKDIRVSKEAWAF